MKRFHVTDALPAAGLHWSCRTITVGTQGFETLDSLTSAARMEEFRALARNWPAEHVSTDLWLRSPFPGVSVQDLLRLGWANVTGTPEKTFHEEWAFNVIQLVRLAPEQIEAEIALHTLRGIG